ncbi:hypothetical protein QYM18_21875 [Ectopseudomonas chengduensis]|nr:hypothetical protein [Pseudomonas chengduensis]WKC37067.1 hypothetical protein QYM18_21875 [Pseudomonas chengduensis]
MKFSETLKDLRMISEELKAQGITVKKLDEAISDLSKHQENIEKIEENIDAIKSEVIAPIKEELVQNKTAGKFSVFGFWVGALGLIVSIGTVLFQPGSVEVYSAPVASKNCPEVGHVNPAVVNECDVSERLRQIENQLLFPKGLSTSEGEVFVEIGRYVEFASLGEDKFYLKVDSINDWPAGAGIKGGVKIYKNSLLLGVHSLKNNIVRIDAVDELRDWYDAEVLAVDVGDKVRVGDVGVEVRRVLSREPKGRLIGDAQDGIVFYFSKVQDVAYQGVQTQ